MSFTTIEFLPFMLLVGVLHFSVAARWQAGTLWLASLVFYAQAEWRHLPVLLGVTLVAYLAARRMEGKEKKEQRRPYMWIGVATILGLLLGFKYWELLAPDAWRIGLPLGLSFYALAAASYVIDAQRGWVKPEKSFVRLGAFVSFFPLLLSGPIERAPRILKQLDTRMVFEEARVKSGLVLFAWGLFKKAAVADRLSPLAQGVFESPATQPGWAVLLGTAAACLQLYADFSGYSDMAIGVAKVLGVEVMENFKRPFLARSIEELWGKRWHLALTNWMKDYVFNPITYLMRRQPAARRNLIILVVFFLTGLWHGAEARFLAWGFLNGVFVLAHVQSAGLRGRMVAALGLARWPRAHALLSVLFTVTLFGLGAVVFLARGFGDALLAYRQILIGWSGASLGAVKAQLLELFGPTQLGLAALGVGVLFAVELHQEMRGSVRAFLAAQPVWIRWPAYLSLVISVVLLGNFAKEQFIYQQF